MCRDLAVKGIDMTVRQLGSQMIKCAAVTKAQFQHRPRHIFDELRRVIDRRALRF